MTTYYEVEWCSSEGPQDGVDFDPDLCEYETKDFKTLKAAEKFAESVVLKAVSGEALITAFTLEPYEVGFPAAYKEYHGDPIQVVRE